ncbi:MAG TPA: geranylgeranyl reductase family protein [Acidimicrobiales bacterium]|nr:geranylgeranyl reductase family protein [Acidimicrobiales bacterium]
MTREDADVIVVGAGPAGAAAAIVLARAGRRVIVADRARFPRDKCCGDGITGAALPRLRDLGLDASRVASWRDVDRSVFVSQSGRSLALETGGGRRGVLAVATRADLDAALLDVARRAGARVVEEARLDSAALTADGVSLEFERVGSLHASFVIAADGAWSPTRRALQPTEVAIPKWQAARTYVEGVEGAAAAEARVWFDADLLPGYAWSFPLGDGRANVGVGALRTAGGGGGWIVRRLGSLLQSDHVRSFLGEASSSEGRAAVWPIPTELKRENLIGGQGRALFAGDAVGATDPMTGEGIAEALQTGTLAAEALIAGRPNSYAATAGRALVWRHRRRQLCSDLLRRRALAAAGLAVADANHWTRAQFTRWIFE